MRRTGIPLLLGFIASACVCLVTAEVKAESKESTNERLAKELRSALRSAPEQLELAGQKLKLEARLFGGAAFLPGPSTYTPLSGTVRVRTTDGKAFPKGVWVDTVWVIYGNQLWSSAPETEEEGKDTLEVGVSGGPLWPPYSNLKVDVVVLLKDRKGQSYLLRASEQGVGHTS